MIAGGELPGPGSVVAGRYRVIALLGRGGMGVVFDAIDTRTSRAVALKWMLPAAAEVASSVSRFLLEARAASRIEHPNVIGILDAGVDRGSPYLVMERLRGESLAQRLKRGRLGVVEALDLLIPACRGVAEAHREGVVHRDLKPDNIFVCEPKDGSGPRAKILDFGIAKLYEPEGDVPITKSRVALGTPRYMSPQQLGAPREVDPRFDVYAMGVVLYESLTGRLPYDGAGLLELVAKIAEGTPTPVCALAPDVPPVLELTILRAMHARAEVRHATMDALVAELEAIRASIAGDGPAPLGPAVAALASIASATTPLALTVPEDGPTPLAHRPPRSSPSSAPPRTPEPRPREPQGEPARAHPRTSAPEVSPRPRGALLALIALGVVALCAAAITLGWVAWLERGRRAPRTTLADTTSPAHFELGFGGGCAPRFDGVLSVTRPRPGELVIASRRGALIEGFVRIDAGTATLPGRAPLTQEHFFETGLTVSVGDGDHASWGSYRGAADTDEWPVSGTLVVRRFEPERGVIDITFEDVVLGHLADLPSCFVEGRLQTFRLAEGD